MEGNEWFSWNYPSVYNVTGWFTGVTGLSKEVIGNLSPRVCGRDMITYVESDADTKQTN